MGRHLPLPHFSGIFLTVIIALYVKMIGRLKPFAYAPAQFRQRGLMDRIDQAAENSPHASSLRNLRNALYSNTASVLVGSGFSRNANPKMPTWDSWADTLAKGGFNLQVQHPQS